MLKLLFIAAVSITLLSSCEHEQFKPVAGKGGAATIFVYPAHHGVTSSLDSVTVYIKYNTLNAPADGKYDDSAACTYVNALPMCSFPSLWNGDYYIYAKGYDYAIPGKIRGGLPFTVKAQQSFNFTLPLGEESGY
jgi:hypothetical protein